MITLKEWMELADYRVTEGSDYHVNVPKLYSLSAWNGEQDGWSFFVAFDPRDDQRVYVAEACDYKNNRACWPAQERVALHHRHCGHAEMRVSRQRPCGPAA